jgi:hypothetical protein
MNPILRSKLGFSTKSSPTAAKSAFKRIAVGTNRLSSPQPEGTFASVIATAIQNGVNTFETTLHKEEEMRRAVADALMFLSSRSSDQRIPGLDERSLKIIGKISYQTSTTDASASAATTTTTSHSSVAPGGILQEQSEHQTVYHNLSPQHISQTIQSSPLVQLYQNISKEPALNAVDVVYCAHNPEAQGMELLQQDAPHEEVRGFVKDQLTHAFIALERAVAENQIGSYGVSSNGLGLASSHPMHLSWEDVLSASAEATREVHGFDCGRNENHLSTVQLPANLLETHGLKVANRIKQFLASPDAQSVGGMVHLDNVEIHATRPLTCFPDRGVGTGHPFKLVDYELPTVEDGSNKTWSHLMKSAPMFYTSVLNETMAHFDATHLIEIKGEEGRQLTVEERETLDGCKLLQSMIHDLDANLTTGQLRSFAAYEEELYSKVVPLIHDTFEELDGDSAAILHRFFHAHGVAVRQSIAKTTRELLRSGGEGGVQKYDIAHDETMQDFALRFLLEQQCEGDFVRGKPLLDRVIVGCPKAEHVIEAVQSADKQEAKEGEQGGGGGGAGGDSARSSTRSSTSSSDDKLII